MLESLYTSTDDFRNRFDEFEAKAKEVSSASDYMSIVARARKRTRHFDEVQGTAVVVLEGRDKFRVQMFFVIVNQLHTALQGRIYLQPGTYPDEMVQFVDFAVLCAEVVQHQLNFRYAGGKPWFGWRAIIGWRWRTGTEMTTLIHAHDLRALSGRTVSGTEGLIIVCVTLQDYCGL